MEIIEYTNLNNEPMILIIDDVNDTAQSMTKAHYDELKANEAETI
jgi:hypoxanthine phosphoribosyltransferase